MLLNGVVQNQIWYLVSKKFLKHYYLQGLHQVVVNADFYMTGKLIQFFI